MIRVASRFHVREGMVDEYKRRHDEIWPEMLKLMKNAGITNYSIWNMGNDLFGYFEVEDYSKCIEEINRSDVKKRWDEYMGDIIHFDPDPVTGRMPDMKLMFLME